MRALAWLDKDGGPMRPFWRWALIVGGGLFVFGVVGLLAFNTLAILTEDESDRESDPARSAPVAPEAQSTPTCPAQQVYMPARGRCVSGFLSCASSERWDRLRQRCVPDIPEPEEEEPEAVNCGFGEWYDYSLRRCVPAPHSCTSEEEYDWTRKRCVPKTPSSADCGFGERYDSLKGRCAPGPLSCTSSEQYDWLRSRCVPKTD